MSPAQVQAILELARQQGILPMGDPNDLAEALNSQRPKIKLPGDNRELGQFAREVGEILSARDLFRRDMTPVIVNGDKQRLDMMTAEMLRTWAETHLVCYKDKTLGAGDDARTITIVKTMNLDTARGTLASWQFLGLLPEIERVNSTRLPVLRRNGAIELLPNGYAPEQKIFTIQDNLTIDEEMTLEQAKAWLDELLGEFPFRDDGGRSKAVQIAAMLTMFCAGLLPRRAIRPGFIFTANSPGAGKTLCAKIAIIMTARSAAPRSFPRKEEMKKTLDVLAMDATPYILFDNIRGQVGGEEIEAFITAPEWEGRILGESTKFRVDNVATCFFTGNDSRPTQDLLERCLVVDLFVQEADNRDRKIAHVIDDTYLGSDEIRSKGCSALWALVRAWDAAGRPPAPTQMPRFEQWSAVVGGIVAHAGYGDCCRKAELASTRGDVAEMRKLVLEIEDIAQSSGKTAVLWEFSELIELIQEKGFFADMELPAKKGESSEMWDEGGSATPAARSFFGRFFTKFDQRLFATEGGGRLRFEVRGKGNSRRYVVVREEADAAKAGGE